MEFSKVFSDLYVFSLNRSINLTDIGLFFIQVYATPEDDDVLLNGFAWRAKSNTAIMVAKNDYTAGLIDVRSG